MSKVDITLNKNDIVELLIQEREDQLSAELKEVETQYSELIKDMQANPAKYKPDTQAHEDLVIGAGYALQSKQLEAFHHRYTLNFINDEQVAIQVSFPVSAACKLGTRINELRQELYSMNQNIRKYKAKFTKEILSRSEEGKSLLKSLQGINNNQTLLPGE